MSSYSEQTIEDSVFNRCARLVAVQHAVAEIAGGRKVDIDPQALRDAILMVRKAVRAVDGAYAVFIGGLAVQEYGFMRFTEDVDVVVDAAHYREVIDKLREMGFEITSEFTLKNRQTGALLDLLREGATLKDSKFSLPHPQELGLNLGFARLSALIRLKLDTGGRLKDLADIVELLKRSMDQASIMRNEIPPTYHEKYDELVAQAHRELK
jgi:hypothetical protein